MASVRNLAYWAGASGRVAIEERTMNVSRIGVIYPSNGIYETEFLKFTPPGVSAHFTRWRWPARNWFKPNWPDRMASLADDPDIAACAAMFNHIDPAVVTLACTSVSFAAGAGGDIPVLENIKRGTQAKASSTSTGFTAACRSLGIETVAIASVYRKEVTQRLVDYLADGGITTVSHRSAGWEGQPDDENRLTTQDVCTMAEQCDEPSAAAILIPETNICTSEAIPRIEKLLRKPVLTAIQVTCWHAARLAGSDSSAGIGLLWQTREAVSHS
jgi:maleate isomerase